MDFSIPQQNSTQFVYVLPYSDGSALVEVTRFGSEKIHPKESEILLNDYINGKYGAYKILDEEHGCIPMTTSPIKEEFCQGVIQLGARNYKIKPSTGYAFKRMYYHAEEITQMLIQGKSPIELNRRHAETLRGRFAFYDGLLLDILNRNPEFGKPIFETLFKKNGIQQIFTFLDEKSNLLEEITIFSRLPLGPFLSALWRKVTSNILFRPFLLTLLCTLFIVLPPKNTLVQLIETGSLIAGLIIIGIPHGALDHLLETGNLNARMLPKFILKYISIAVAMAFLWYILPTPSLILFLIYSSWHFGQADGKQWSFNPTESFAWGVSVLLYITGTHLDETNSILATMGTIRMPFRIVEWALIPWFIRFASKRNYEGLFTVIWLFLTSQIPLMLAFGIYFIGQHSFTGWQHIKNHLKMSNQALWLHSLPFHIGAWLLLGLFCFVQTLFGQIEHFFTWSNFFIFLACLSLPHVLAMQSMYNTALKLTGKSNKEIK
jgi:Brp/Blh family beta-carotene 15,15'-monooxygenase